LNIVIERVGVVDADAIFVPEFSDDQVLQLNSFFELLLGDICVKV
tara:strand:+ start:2004 stop:2138 length:135 start_codon:yes stop_codon:yes gene_type:complete